MKKPNILTIMSDEHDPAVAGCYGDPVVQTPHLDQLAEGGVTFDSCYTTSPLCAPARLSFTAGKYISRCGAWSNTCWLPSDDCPSIASVLGSAGYESYLCGKQHYDNSRRYGFHDILPEARTNNANKSGRGERRNANDTNPNVESWNARSSQFYPGEDSSILQHDRVVTDKACEFLRDRPREGSPFFLFVGHLSPHFPLIAPQKYYDMYKDKIPVPVLPEGWFEKQPTNYKQLIYGFGIDYNDHEAIKKGRELYWALTSWMDTEIGKVLAALGNSEVADNTVVIYTSDHGENKGDHGTWWKNNMYEHSARIPLIVSYPDRLPGGQRRTKACSLVDLVQTIADLAGAETPDDWDGDSLLPYLDDPENEWKDMAVSEYYAHNISSGFAMLRQGNYRYVYHTAMDETHGPERELYNLVDDPKEWNNIANSPEHKERVAQMHSCLVEELGQDPEITEKICREDYSKGYQRD